MTILEALQWLEGETGNGRPRSVHPAVWRVIQGTAARDSSNPRSPAAGVAPHLPDAQLWALVLAATETSRARGRPTTWFRSVRARRQLLHDPEEWFAAWQRLVNSLARPSRRRRCHRVRYHFARLGARARGRSSTEVWVDTFRY